MSIVFISYPKSGRTWMRYILHLLNCQAKFTHAGQGTSFSKRKPGVAFSQLKLEELGDKNIFMHRNPLDTAVSMYFQIHKHDTPKFKLKTFFSNLEMTLMGRRPPQDINRFVLHPAWGIENICRFNQAWLEHFQKTPEYSLIIRYEDAKKDPSTVIQALIDFTGCAQMDVSEVVRKSTFESMKELELGGKSKELRLRGKQNGDEDSMKVRRGIVRGYTDYLTPDTIHAAEKIADRYGFKI